MVDSYPKFKEEIHQLQLWPSVKQGLSQFSLTMVHKVKTTIAWINNYGSAAALKVNLSITIGANWPSMKPQKAMYSRYHIDIYEQQDHRVNYIPIVKLFLKAMYGPKARFYR